jgi:peptide/nickel transport system ATP-binding protein
VSDVNETGAKPILQVRDLKVYFKTIFGDAKSVDGVSFDVYENEILGIAGESGCGKSTFVEAALRLIKPPGEIEAGRILYRGKDILTMKEYDLQQIRWKEIAYIPQGSMNALNPVLKIEEQLTDAITTHSANRGAEAKQMAAESLVSVGMPAEVARMYPHELSGGMRQRVTIGMATSLRPDLLFADEPTTGLDVIMVRLNLQTLASLRDEHGITVVLVSHDLACHAEICDRICIMYAGRMMEVGMADQIFHDPLHPYTQGLIGAVPSLEDKTTKSIAGVAPTPLNPPSGCRFHPRCPKAMDVCSKVEPELTSVGPDRQVRCHLYKEDGENNGG